MNAENIFEYNSLNYKEFLKKFRDIDSSEHMLIVLAGAFTTNRKAALDELKREVIGDAVEIDLAELVTPHEEESYKNIEKVLSEIDAEAPLVVIRNPEQLSGAYTGFTSSIVKYATPQEKFFLKKITEINAPVVLEFKDVDQLDRTITRTADAVVIFREPSSLIEKLAWKVQNVHVHGSSFLSPRPH
ncbi:MAG: hypothetical protein WD357_03615 [Gracilimonas sp.]